jgi:excisionase family DNA binding protein
LPDLLDHHTTHNHTAQGSSRLRRRKDETREELLSRLLDPVLTLEETARMLDVCPTTVRRYTNRGILPHERSKGNQRRFKLSSVLAFMQRQSNEQ